MIFVDVDSWRVETNNTMRIVITSNYEYEQYIKICINAYKYQKSNLEFTHRFEYLLLISAPQLHIKKLSSTQPREFYQFYCLKTNKELEYLIVYAMPIFSVSTRGSINLTQHSCLKNSMNSLTYLYKHLCFRIILAIEISFKV